jgi:probable rRNA maturation factor
VRAAKVVECRVWLVSDRAMLSYNKKWRDKAKTTDVLSFPVHQFDARDRLKQKSRSRTLAYSPPLLDLGDVVISKDQALRQAKKFEWNTSYEVLRLFIHGCYHLIGFDHERSREEEHLQSDLEQKTINLVW